MPKAATSLELGDAELWRQHTANAERWQHNQPAGCLRESPAGGTPHWRRSQL